MQTVEMTNNQLVLIQGPAEQDHLFWGVLAKKTKDGIVPKAGAKNMLFSRAHILRLV